MLRSKLKTLVIVLALALGVLAGADVCCAQTGACCATNGTCAAGTAANTRPATAARVEMNRDVIVCLLRVGWVNSTTVFCDGSA